MTDAQGGVVSYTYDGVGNRLSMTDANSHTTNYTYDDLNRLETESDPLSHTWTYGLRCGRTAHQPGLDANGITTTLQLR